MSRQRNPRTMSHIIGIDLSLQENQFKESTIFGQTKAKITKELEEKQKRKAVVARALAGVAGVSRITEFIMQK